MHRRLSFIAVRHPFSFGQRLSKLTGFAVKSLYRVLCSAGIISPDDDRLRVTPIGKGADPVGRGGQLSPVCRVVTRKKNMRNSGILILPDI